MYLHIDDVVKVLHSFQSQRRTAEECSNYCAIVLISHADKVKCKLLQARL